MQMRWTLQQLHIQLLTIQDLKTEKEEQISERYIVMSCLVNTLLQKVSEVQPHHHHQSTPTYPFSSCSALTNPYTLVL